MGDAIRILVHTDIGKLSPNLRIHWQERRRRAKVAAAAAVAAWLAAGSPVADGPVAVSLIIRRGRAMDADNAIASCKAVIDALFRRSRTGAGVTPDDGPRWVHLGDVRQETGGQWRGREEVEVVVVPHDVTLDAGLEN